MQTTSRKVDPFLKNSTPARRPPKRKAASPEPDKGSPAYIKRKIEKSFDTAALHLKDRSRVKHPSKPNLRLVDAYPMLPDLDAFPDSGAYVTVKFTHNPIPSSSTYDTRLLSGIFKPIERTESEEQAYEAAVAAHARDPDHYPRPDNKMNYEFFLASDTKAADLFRRRFDVDNPDRDSRDLYPRRPNGEPFDCFQFRRVRAYETAHETELDHESKYDQELILAFNNDESRGQRGLYYYPVMQRSTIRSQRTKNIARTVVGLQTDEEQTIDQLDVTVDEPGENLKREMTKYREHPFGFQDDEEEEETAVSPARDGDGEAESQATAGRSAKGSPGEDDERDAEGDEE
jgi:RNA polymerase II-associated factor 1